jgi:hypothetical protein
LLGPFAHRLPYFIRQQPSCLGNSLSHTESKMQMLQQALGCDWSEVRNVPPLDLLLLLFWNGCWLISAALCVLHTQLTCITTIFKRPRIAIEPASVSNCMPLNIHSYLQSLMYVLPQVCHMISKNPTMTSLSATTIRTRVKEIKQVGALAWSLNDLNE